MSAASHEAARRFFMASQYAVAGASQDTKKYGYKLLAWYHAHSLPVLPINPRTPSIQVPAPPASNAISYATYASPSALPNAASTSLSIVTPPVATKEVLRNAKDAGIKAVWLQPGSFDDESETLARELFESVLAGEEKMVGGEGWCVLLHGDRALKAAREKGRI